MKTKTRLSTPKAEAKSNNTVTQTRRAPLPYSANSSVDRIMFLQRTIGNQAVQRLFSGEQSAKSKERSAKCIVQSAESKGHGAKGAKSREHGAKGIVQRIEDSRQKTVGSEKIIQKQKEEEEEIRASKFQKKLTMGAPGDVYEQEADKVAEQVSAFYHSGDLTQGIISRLNVPKVLGLTNRTARISRVSPSGRRSAIFANHESGGGGTVDPSIESRIMQSKGSGSPVPSSISNVMALRTGHDFSNVRVKTGSEAESLNATLGARAFTHGSDIWLGKGESAGNVKLMSHELTHVVQQGAARRISPQNITGLGGMKSPDRVLGALQAMANGEGNSASLYAKEIAQFQKENSPQSIQALQDQILPKSKAISINQKSNSQVMRICGCGGDSSTPAVPTVTGVLTPQDNFAGRIQTNFGLAEKIDLSFLSTETAAEIGGLKWHKESGAGTVAGGNNGLGTFTAGGNPGAVNLALKIDSGSRAGTTLDNKNISVVAPSGSYMIKKAGTNIWHKQGKASVGFKGISYLEPRNVSFSNIQRREGTCAGKGTGFFHGDTGQVHRTGSWMNVDNGNSATGCEVLTTDTVSTGPHNGPFSNGTFLWPIPREYRVGSGSAVPFATANHQETVDNTGKATIEKHSAGPFSKNLNDPDSNY